jgi:DNA-binding beta-propeller fold protein YncE
VSASPALDGLTREAVDRRHRRPRVRRASAVVRAEVDDETNGSPGGEETENMGSNTPYVVVGTLLVAVAAFADDPTPSAPAAKEPAAAYRVVKTLKVGGEGRWDLFAIDSRTQRLYVPRSDHVLVVDADKGTVLGQIDGTKGVHGVAVAAEFERGFKSNGQDASMTVFDLKTLAVLGTVKAGTNPDAILYEPSTKRVLCFNGKSDDVTAVDAGADLSKDVATERLELGGKPELGVADGKGAVFVNIEDKSEVVRFDAKTLKVTARWPLAPGEEPSGIAMDAEHHRLFCACGNKMMVVLDSETGKVLATPPIGERVDGAGFDAATGTAFASNGDATLTAVRETAPGKFEVVQTIATQKGARTMIVDPSTHRLYLPTADFGPAPAPTADQPRPRPSIVPGSFVILVVDR